MNEVNHFQNPKTAIIRLLKAQGCCSCDEKAVQSAPSQEMSRYKEELQVRVVRERARLGEIPCVITLAEEIEELREVVGGLGRQNAGRLQTLRNSQKMNVTQSTKWDINESEQQLEHERLQAQYASLLRTLESTNQVNRKLVQRLSRS